MTLDTPVAFFVFRRPDLTARVFEAIAAAQPARLLIIGDGPRQGHPGDEPMVAQTRAVVERVTWPCRVETNYSASNLGCKQCVEGGLAWVFSQVEEAIILEDDCLPHPSFFPYCAELLRRYRDDERIVSIGGVNFQDGVSRSPHGYFFSKFFHCWGWASWRRVCRQYDRDLRTWPDFRDSGGLANWTDCPREEAFWRNLFERQHRGEFDSWAYAWLYSCWAQAGLSILPDVNLVSNIGFGDGAHHTRSSDSPLANRPTAPIRLGSPPACVVRCRAADQYTFLNYFRRPRGWRRWLCRIQRLRRRTAVGATRVATPD
jgi:hypothetical protein